MAVSIRGSGLIIRSMATEYSSMPTGKCTRVISRPIKSTDQARSGGRMAAASRGSGGEASLIRVGRKTIRLR